MTNFNLTVSHFSEGGGVTPDWEFTWVVNDTWLAPIRDLVAILGAQLRLTVTTISPITTLDNILNTLNNTRQVSARRGSEGSFDVDLENKVRIEMIKDWKYAVDTLTASGQTQSFTQFWLTAMIRVVPNNTTTVFNRNIAIVLRVYDADTTLEIGQWEAHDVFMKSKAEGGTEEVFIPIQRPILPDHKNINVVYYFVDNTDRITDNLITEVFTIPLTLETRVGKNQLIQISFRDGAISNFRTIVSNDDFFALQQKDSTEWTLTSESTTDPIIDTFTTVIQRINAKLGGEAADEIVSFTLTFPNHSQFNQRGTLSLIEFNNLAFRSGFSNLWTLENVVRGRGTPGSVTLNDYVNVINDILSQIEPSIIDPEVGADDDTPPIIPPDDDDHVVPPPPPDDDDHVVPPPPPPDDDDGVTPIEEENIFFKVSFTDGMDMSFILKRWEFDFLVKEPKLFDPRWSVSFAENTFDSPTLTLVQVTERIKQHLATMNGGNGGNGSGKITLGSDLLKGIVGAGFAALLINSLRGKK